MNWRMEVLQTSALPLGYAAIFLERETRFELATPTLARLYSTTELFPLTKSEAVFNFLPLNCQHFLKKFLFFVSLPILNKKNKMINHFKIFCSGKSNIYFQRPDSFVVERVFRAG